jgi:hypothetical protein
MATEVAVRKAAADLAAAESMPEVLRAACAAADVGEWVATALARASVVDGPGYLAAADAFAVVRVELHEFAQAAPAGLLASGVGGNGTRQGLTELAALLRDRLSELLSVAAGEVAAALAGASAAADDVVRALSGPVPDDVDVR